MESHRERDRRYVRKLDFLLQSLDKFKISEYRIPCLKR